MGREENSRQREKHRQSPGSSGEHSQGEAREDGGEVGAEARGAWGGRWGWRGRWVLTRKGLCGLVKNFLCILTERLWAQLTEIKPPRFPMQMRTLRMKSHQRWTKLRKKHLPATLHMTFVTVNRLVMHKSPATTKRIMGELVAIARDLFVHRSLNQVVTGTPFSRVYL